MEEEEEEYEMVMRTLSQDEAAIAEELRRRRPVSACVREGAWGARPLRCSFLSCLPALPFTVSPTPRHTSLANMAYGCVACLWQPHNIAHDSYQLWPSLSTRSLDLLPHGHGHPPLLRQGLVLSLLRFRRMMLVLLLLRCRRMQLLLLRQAAAASLLILWRK